MDKSFLVQRLQIQNSFVAFSLYPEKFSENKELEQIKININNVKATILGYYSLDKNIIDEYPLVYNPTELVEDLQLIENTSYYLDIVVSVKEGADVVTKDHNQSISPFKYIPSFNNKIKKGIFNWKSYVGKDIITICIDGDSILQFPIEVRAKKVGYINDYRRMVDDISNNIADVIWNDNSPSSLVMSKEKDKKPSLLEYFFFLREAMSPNYIPQFWQIINSNPTTKLMQIRKDVEIGQLSSIDSNSIISIITRPEYIVESELGLYRLPNLDNRLPLIVDESYNKLSYDTPENQFLLFWLKEIHNLLNEVIIKSERNTLVYVDTKRMLSQVNEMLQHTMFHEVTEVSYVENNNLALRRLAGYSGIYSLYEVFDKRGSLAWDNYFNLLYHSEIKPVYDIYELWILFELIKILKKVSNNNIEYSFSKKESQIKSVRAPFGRFKIELYYQKYCKTSYNCDPLTSYSIPLVPDYIISVWENTTYLGGIAVDAKYKYDSVINVSDLYEDDIEEIIGFNTERKVKPIDLVKMHSYKDAIRGIYGSYVIFPGKDTQIEIYSEQKTLLPSIGAFPLYPFNDETPQKQTQINSLQEIVLTAIYELTL